MDYQNMKFKYYYQRDVTRSSSDDNYKNFNKFLNTTAGLNSNVSVHLSTAVTYWTALQ